METVRRQGVDSLIGTVLLIGGLLALPFFLAGYDTLKLTYVIIFAIAILGLNLLIGFSGQVSLGHGAFLAVGAYTTGILSVRYGVPLVVTIPIAGLVSGALGFLVGVPALRLSGLYLSLATFAMAVSVPTVIRKFEDVTGGSRGLSLRAMKAPAGVDITPEQTLYLLVLIIAVLLFAFARNIVRSSTGRALMAIREGELAATAFGINLALYKTLAFGLSAFYAGVAGALLAIATTFIGPDSFAVDQSIKLLVGTVVGGLGTLSGPVFGALLVQFLPGYAESFSKAAPSISYGVILIVVMFLMPTGIAGLWRTAYRRLRAKTART
jgi:branched-chain amino acid transport system permease protein